MPYLQPLDHDFGTSQYPFTPPSNHRWERWTPTLQHIYSLLLLQPSPLHFNRYKILLPDKSETTSSHHSKSHSKCCTPHTFTKLKLSLHWNHHVNASASVAPLRLTFDWLSAFHYKQAEGRAKCSTETLVSLYLSIIFMDGSTPRECICLCHLLLALIVSSGTWAFCTMVVNDRPALISSSMVTVLGRRSDRLNWTLFMILSCNSRLKSGVVARLAILVLGNTDRNIRPEVPPSSLYIARAQWPMNPRPVLNAGFGRHRQRLKIQLLAHCLLKAALKYQRHMHLLRMVGSLSSERTEVWTNAC